MQTADWRGLFPEASKEQWGDWRWQMRHSIRTPEQLARLIPLTEDERRGCEETAAVFPASGPASVPVFSSVSGRRWQR